MTFWILSAIKRLPIDTGCLGFDRGRHVEGLICLSLAHYIQPKRISSCGRTAPPLYMRARMQDVWHVCFCSSCVYLCISGAKITTHMDSICGVCVFVCSFVSLACCVCDTPLHLKETAVFGITQVSAVSWTDAL